MGSTAYTTALVALDWAGAVKKNLLGKCKKNEQVARGKRWSAIPLPCLMNYEMFEGKQGSGPEGDEVL